jgi:lysozyme family protein
MTAPSTHAECFAALVLVEGSDLDLSANDPGNWTGGAVGAGRLTGSRYGISSASYPDVDKATLTAVEAEAIYLRDFWTPNRCGELPASVRYLVYSCAVNSGARNAGRWLQLALEAQGVDCGGVDGVIGERTVTAAALADPTKLAREISAQRLAQVSATWIFAMDRLGLSRRIVDDATTAAA